MRAGIYARYSSDRQNERSIDDQLRICREYLERRGDALAETFCDYALSGSSLKTRPEALRMLEAARAGQIDLILAEDLDRLSRDQEDIAFIFKRARFSGARLMTIADGEINELHIGLKGTMNAIELTKLAAKVRRGQRGRIERGFAAGGLSYGYRVVRELDDDGNLKRGLRVIDETQAAVVRRIYDCYLAGQSPRAIAASLNREQVTAPFGGRWNASSINGNPQRGIGILCNALYAGRLVYNRTRMVKDPDSGKRISRLNPPSEWVTHEAPDLRIVAEDQWQAVQARKRACIGTPALMQRRSKYLFSGLIRCGVCCGSYISAGRGALECSAHRESNSCTNGHRLPRALLERRVLDGLRNQLLEPTVMQAAVEAYQAERNRLGASAGTRRRALERRIAQLDREIKRGVRAIFDGTASRAVQIGLADLERQKDGAEAELAVLAEKGGDIVSWLPAVVETYVKAIEELRAVVVADPVRWDTAAPRIRRLIERIDVAPGPNMTWQITAFGTLAALLQNEKGTNRQLLMVAGEGVEPPTLGL